MLAARAQGQTTAEKTKETRMATIKILNFVLLQFFLIVFSPPFCCL
jgi:hypothetical protein